MAKAIGVGGVFFKALDSKALAAWYEKNLGIRSEHGSLMFDGPESMGMTVFAPFSADTAYFGDGPQQFMLNFRVDDLDALLNQLAEGGVKIDPKRQDESYGRFAWIWDPEGNRIELWQPTPDASEDSSS
jgi:predicted enzyme related to lactoylglutathione lyase